MPFYPFAFSFSLETRGCLEQQIPQQVLFSHQTVCTTLWLRCWNMVWGGACPAPVLRARTTLVTVSKDETFFHRKSEFNCISNIKVLQTTAQESWLPSRGGGRRIQSWVWRRRTFTLWDFSLWDLGSARSWHAQSHRVGHFSNKKSGKLH